MPLRIIIIIIIIYCYHYYYYLHVPRRIVSQTRVVCRVVGESIIKRFVTTRTNIRLSSFVLCITRILLLSSSRGETSKIIIYENPSGNRVWQVHAGYGARTFPVFVWAFSSRVFNYEYFFFSFFISYSDRLFLRTTTVFLYLFRYV